MLDQLVEDEQEITYQFCTAEDAPQVLDLLVNTFIATEPLNVSIDEQGLREVSALDSIHHF